MPTDLTMTVLSKVVPARKASEARDGISAGQYPVDFTVKVSGMVVVEEDGNKTPTCSIPVKEVLAMFIARSGALREKNIELLAACISDALEAKGGKAQGALKKEFDAVFGEIVDNFLSTLPRTKVRGDVVMDGVTLTITED